MKLEMRDLMMAVTLSLALGTSGAQAAAGEPSGKSLVLAPAKGNCVACHALPTVKEATPAGNSGSPLIAMSARFPDKAALRAMIWDATAVNPASFMPPFGKHRILTGDEIDRIVEFIYEL